MTKEELRNLLAVSSKSNRKALAKIAAEMENDDPERYKNILSKSDWEGEALIAYRSYQNARVFSTVSMVLAAIVVIAGYLMGDFGLQLLSSGWMNRYVLAAGILIAMALFAVGILLVNNRKERLVAYAILEEL